VSTPPPAAEAIRATFIVRLWKERGELHWRGFVEMVGRDDRGGIATPADVAGFIERALRRQGGDGEGRPAMTARR
jgi:hypothetical protein